MNITISNYQSWKELSLELDKGIILINGSSDNGKTSIFRAIMALLKNENGRKFIRHGSGQCQVQIDNVVWSKGNETYYQIGEQRYDRLGTNVPPEVYNSLLIYPIDLDGEETFLNFAEQWDAPFLLRAGPSKTAKLLGHFSGTDTIYSGIQKCNKDVRDMQKQCDYLQQRTIELQEAIDNFPDISNYSDMLEQYKLLEGYFEKSKQFTNIVIPELDFDGIDLLRKYLALAGQIIDVPDIPLPDTETIETLRQYFYSKQEYNKLKQEIDNFVQEYPECPMCGKGW